MTALSRLAGLIVFAGTILLMLGFFGRVAAPLDSFSHFRVYLCAVTLLAALVVLLTGRTISRILATGAIAISGYAALTAAPFLAKLPQEITEVSRAAVDFAPIDEGTELGADGTFTLLQMNLLYKADTARGIATIRSANADFITLQEASGPWREALEGLADLYPHRSDCRSNRLRASVVLMSKRPFVGDVLCKGRLRFVAGTVALGDGETLTIGAQHLFWPWPRAQGWQIDRLQPTLATLSKPAVIGGDFNATPWSAAIKTYGAASRTRPVPEIGPTFAPDFLPARWKAFVGLPIDNVLASDEITILSAQTLAPTGSDHLPVLVRFRLQSP